MRSWNYGVSSTQPVIKTTNSITSYHGLARVVQSSTSHTDRGAANKDDHNDFITQWHGEDMYSNSLLQLYNAIKNKNQRQWSDSMYPVLTTQSYPWVWPLKSTEGRTYSPNLSSNLYMCTISVKMYANTCMYNTHATEEQALNTYQASTGNSRRFCTVGVLSWLSEVHTCLQTHTPLCSIHHNWPSHSKKQDSRSCSD